MPNKRQIIFYDSTCPLCQKAVHFVLKHDTKHQFLFAPLQGETAKTLPLPQVDSLIVTIQTQETHTTYAEGKAVLFLLGKLFFPLRVFSYLPGGLVNPLYRWIAKRRHNVCPKTTPLPKENNPYFLP